MELAPTSDWKELQVAAQVDQGAPPDLNVGSSAVVKQLGLNVTYQL